jgi:hypothetical protein
MPTNSATVHSLRRVFQQAFVVHDIAESLVSFDDNAPAEQIRAFMESRRFEVVGVRRNGCVEGYVACANNYDVADELRMLDIDVKPMGVPLSDRLKGPWKVLTS